MTDKTNLFHKKPLSTAVLFLVFNRLDVTKKVFDTIRQARPPRIYIASDGPRNNKIGEPELVEEVRSYVLENIDWDCNVRTLLRDKNLGCKYAVSDAISWFFKNEEQGIVLEDDCLPSQSFFWFCEELLEKYKDDNRIGQISGNNFQGGIKRGDADYYFSIYNHIWGWASWSDRWKDYDVELKNFDNADFIDILFNNRKTIKFWKDRFADMKLGKIDTWDYQWTFQIWKQRQLTILPNVNLIKNIGFGEDATHTINENEFSNIDCSELILKKHPKAILQNKEADIYTSERMFNKKPLHIRIFNILRKVFNEYKSR